MKFDSYHPAIIFIFFIAVITGTIMFNHPVFIAISFVCPFVWSTSQSGRRALCFNLCLIPLIAVFALAYTYFVHFGVTIISTNFIGNQLTLEALTNGGSIAARIAAVIMWFSCMHRVITSDKIGFLLGRVAPRLSLYFSILLRTVPRLKEKTRKIRLAQRGIGNRSTGCIFITRVKTEFNILGMLVSQISEGSIERSLSMKSRGYSNIKSGRRTSFSIYRFDNRDRMLVVFLFACIIVVTCGLILEQTTAIYNPEILINPMTPTSYVFAIAYVILCSIPIGLEAIYVHSHMPPLQ